jgi:sterol 14-demethylase
VVFDGTPEQRRQAMRNQSLRDKMMRTHAETIAARRGASWNASANRRDRPARLLLRAHALHVERLPDRTAVPRGAHAEYYRVFYELEKGTDAIAYVNPHLPLPVFRKRDRARARLVELLTGVFERRARARGRVRASCSTCCSASATPTARRATRSTRSPGCSSR